MQQPLITSLKNLPKRIELVANLAIIAVSIVLAGVLLKPFVLTSSNQRPATNTDIGRKVSLNEVDWSKSNQTILLVLSNTCKYCTESASFYKRLTEATKNKQAIRLIAILPQSVDDGQKYLSDLGISVDEIRQARLNTIGVSGTPTLLLVNSLGVVTESWIGKLPPEKENEVLSRFL